MRAPEIFDNPPEQKLRPSAVYLNARRFGLSKPAARQCANDWTRLFDTCFTQRVAGQFYNASEVVPVDFPATMPAGRLYVTAHFSAYTFVSIALAKLYQRQVHIVVGKPSAEFEHFLLSSLADAQVDATIIRSDFSQLRNIRKAIEAEAIIVSLIDVPWHRMLIRNREYERFEFGAGTILASKSIFKIADRMELVPTFVLCEPDGARFNLVHYGALTQRECFLTLAKKVEQYPGHFERFCELHAYYEGGLKNNEITTFVLGQHRYLAAAPDHKYWKLGTTLTAALEQQISAGKVEAATRMIKDQVQRVSAREYDDVVYF